MVYGKCLEKIDAGHYRDLKGLEELCPKLYHSNNENCHY